DPGDLQQCGCQRADDLADGCVQVADLTVEPGYLSGHAGERPADVRAELCRAGEGRRYGQVLSPGEVCGGVAGPDVRLRLELVDDHGAALDDAGAVAGEDPQFADVIVDAVPARARGRDGGAGGCGGAGGIGLGAGGCVQFAVGGGQPGRNPGHLLAGQQQAVSEPAGESAAIFDGPGGGAVGDRPDPLQQRDDQDRVVLDGQRLADRPALSPDGHCDV